jgi:transposase
MSKRQHEVFSQANSGRRMPQVASTGTKLWRSCRLLAFTSYLSLWIVERTFSWLGQNRRLSKDYEQHCESEEAMIYIAMTRLMARRLAAA